MILSNLVPACWRFGQHLLRLEAGRTSGAGSYFKVDGRGTETADWSISATGGPFRRYSLALRPATSEARRVRERHGKAQAAAKWGERAAATWYAVALQQSCTRGLRRGCLSSAQLGRTPYRTERHPVYDRHRLQARTFPASSVGGGYPKRRAYAAAPYVHANLGR